MEPEVIFSDTLVAYSDALSFMERRVADIAEGKARECLWFLEHPPLYTAGTSARDEDLLTANTFPVYRAGRGGQFTYHGPGQRVIYIMLDLDRRGRDIRCFVRQIENWIIATLRAFNIEGKIVDGRVGVWVPRPEHGANRLDKIAAIGIRVRRWVSFHGLSINVSPDLSHYGGIVPCGITDQSVTSFLDLGQIISLPELDQALIRHFKSDFNLPITRTRS